MMEFFQEVPVNLSQMRVITRGLYEVAVVDGVHNAEQALIEACYEACRAESDGFTGFQEFLKQPFNINDAAAVLNTVDLRRIFVKSCLLMAYADGTVSSHEREKIQSFAKALEVSAEDFAALQASVQDYLLGQFSKVRNVEALAEVAKKLGTV